jgi:hypothetical protein
MTLLVHSALNGSAAAALVLANLLRRMPLDVRDKSRLATSWLVRCLEKSDCDGSELHRRQLHVRPAIDGRKENRS